MNSGRRVKWLSVLGGVVLIGGGLLANYGAGVPAAGAQTAPLNPLTVILEKLDQVLAALGGSNPTLRWDQALPAAQRFVTLAAFNNAAVLDKNTGLVWEKAPDATPRSWDNATDYCLNKNVGGTVGWRLPSVVELKSVQDPALPAPFVPTSVFTGVLSAGYWSAATDPENPAVAWHVDLGGGWGAAGKTANGQVWCVRGGMNADQY
jgi:hypothetical protein